MFENLTLAGSNLHRTVRDTMPRNSPELHPGTPRNSLELRFAPKLANRPRAEICFSHWRVRCPEFLADRGSKQVSCGFEPQNCSSGGFHAPGTHEARNGKPSELLKWWLPLQNHRLFCCVVVPADAVSSSARHMFHSYGPRVRLSQRARRHALRQRQLLLAEA